MNHSVANIVVDQYSRSLEALKNILLKAREHAKQRKFDENSYLSLKFAPDMFPFSRQIQICSDTAKSAVAKLSGKQAPSFPDEEKTLEDLIGRLDRTLDYVRSFSDKDFANYAAQKVSFPWYPGKYMTGADFLATHSIPNFYFHAAAAYLLLRAHGVEVGKPDFLGNQPWIKE